MVSLLFLVDEHQLPAMRNILGVNYSGELGQPSLFQAAANKSGNGFNTAEVLDFKIFDINLNLKLALDLKQQLHQPLRVENTGIKQVGLKRRNFDVQFGEKHTQAGLDGLLIVR